MDAAVTTAATATGSTPGTTPAGLFGALAGAKGHGPMTGFQALLAAFFGHQGKDAAAGLAGSGASALTGKAALALKSDSKAGQTTMDDALNPTPDTGAAPDDKALDALAKDATQTGLSPDAQALAALFAAPLAKAPPVEETTARAQTVPVAANANDAAVAAVEIGKAGTPGVTFEAGTDQAVAGQATADQGKTDAAPALGRAKLVEIAEALAASRQGARAAAAKTGDAQPTYRAPPPAAAAADKTQVAAQAAAQTAAAAEAATDVAEAAQANPAATAKAAEAEVPSLVPATGKDRTNLRSNRIEASRKDAASQPLFATTPAADGAAKPATALATATAFAAAKPDQADSADDKPADADIAALKADAPVDDGGQAQAPAAAVHASPTSAQAATTAVRGAPETVASLAAQIIKKAEGRATRFDVELHPADLGQVNVRLEIGAHGRLTASMSFENPQAAAELRGRADELQRALESAGFDMSGGLSFDVAGDRGQGQNAAQQETADQGGALRGRAFEAALATAGETANAAMAGALNAYQSRVAPGLDIRI